MDTVTYVNAPILAHERGIKVKESKSRQSRDYVNLLMVTAKDDTTGITAGATLVGTGQEMFVNVLDFDIDIAPSKYMALVSFQDRPGMIGKVGTVIGKNGINIAGLQVGRRPIEGEAGMGLNLDSPLTPEVIEELTSESGINKAMFIVL
jgi:D-3-phosphoglycerate dehydrogenase